MPIFRLPEEVLSQAMVIQFAGELPVREEVDVSRMVG